MKDIMKKLSVVICSLIVIILVVVGCGKNDATIGGEINKTKTNSFLKITPKKITIKEMEDNQRMLTVDFDVENNSIKEEAGIVADDFIIDDKLGNYYYTAENVDNFNFVLKPNEKKSGKGYYLIKKDAIDFNLLYIPVIEQDESENLSWALKQNN